MTNIQTRQLTDKDMHDFRHIRLSALKNNPEMFASTYDIEAKKPLDVFLKVVLDYVVFGTYHQNNIIGMLIFHQEEDLNGIAHAHLYGFLLNLLGEVKALQRNFYRPSLPTLSHVSKNKALCCCNKHTRHSSLSKTRVSNRQVYTVQYIAAKP